MRSFIPLGLAALMTLSAAGCTTMGSGYGTVRGADHAHVTFAWTSGDDVTGKMTATFADGREFNGSYFQVTSDTRVDRLAPLWDGFSPAWHGWRHWDMDPGPDFVKYYSGRVLANLSDPEGEHMRCRFQLVRPQSGMKGGGQGTCQQMDGKPIDATFPSA